MYKMSLIFKPNLELAISIILRERGLCESKHFCFCFFPNYDNKFLIIDTDLVMKFKQDLRLQHGT